MRAWYVLPYSIFAIPITTAMFTELSTYVANNQMPAFVQGLRRGSGKILFILIPFALYLIVFSPCLARLLGGSRMDADSLSQLADYLAWLSVSLPAYGVCTYLQKACSALRRMKLFTVAECIAGAVQIAICLAFTPVWGFNVVGDDLDTSILASIGGWVAWFFAPLGFGNWQGAMATISAEIAKEQATATLAMVAGGDGSAAANVVQLFKGFVSDVRLYKLSALSFLLFNLFVPPCAVAIVNTFKEMGSQKWGWFAVAFQLFVGYVLALNAFQVGALIVTGAWGVWTVITILVDLFVLWMIFRPAKKEVA